MKNRGHLITFAALLAVALVFIILGYATHTQLFYFLAALPIQLLAAIFILEAFMSENKAREKRRQLMHIKSWMFQLDMRKLFITNFQSLKSPPITIGIIKNASLEELKAMRREAESVTYKSDEAMEDVLQEYVNTQDVWKQFMNIAMDFGFEDIFYNMVEILRLISDIKVYKSCNPNRLFIQRAKKHELLMKRVTTVLGDGIRKYLDYAIELKEKQPVLFEGVISEYEISKNLCE